MLKITCYGGVGVIGGNKIMIEDCDSRLLLDFGKCFTESGSFFDTFLQPRTNSSIRDLIRLGILPRIPGIYRRDLLCLPDSCSLASQYGVPSSARRLWSSDVESCEDHIERFGQPYVDGVLISHGHTDHFQHVSYIHPSIPVYGSAVTGAIMRTCQETGMSGSENDVWECSDKYYKECTDKSTFPGCHSISNMGSRKRDFRAMEPFTEIAIGKFIVEAIPVDHSVPGAYSFYIKCPSGKTVLYTGDLRFRGRLSMAPYNISANLLERTRALKPDVVITEGTRINSDSGDSEKDVETEICRMVNDCTGLALVDFGWKDTTRFETLLSVARATNRIIAVSPKLALLMSYLRKIDPERYIDICSDPNVRVYLERKESMLYSLADYSSGKHFAGLDIDWGARSVEMKKAFTSGDEEYLKSRLCHYRDGVRAYEINANPTKYMLHSGYFEMNELFDVDPPRGSTYIRASTEPFNAEMELDEARLKNWLVHFNLMTQDDKILGKHISGHANGDDLCRFLSALEARTIVPIHTEHTEVYVERFQSTCDVQVPSKSEPMLIE